VIPTEALVPLQTLRRTEFYNDWGKRNEIVFSLGINLGVTGGRFRYLALNNGERSGPHSVEVLDFLAQVVPHIQNALRLQERLGDLGNFRGVLNHLTLPVFLIDADCHVREMTNPAKKLSQLREGITLDVRNRLRLEAEFQTTLADEIARLTTAAVTPFRLFRLRRNPESKERVALLMRANSNLLLFDRTFLLVVLQATPVETGQEIAGLYRLTPAETKFVRTLVETGSLDLTIEILEITRNTARTQMASIYSKTGTHRQGQVIQLFSFLGRVTQMGDDRF
jgi:DNA-binding CsgD family transcriptional regulator